MPKVPAGVAGWNGKTEGYLRANSLSHRVWNSYDAFVNACCNAWNKLMNMLERLASITRRTWARAVSGLGGW